MKKVLLFAFVCVVSVAHAQPEEHNALVPATQIPESWGARIVRGSQSEQADRLIRNTVTFAGVSICWWSAFDAGQNACIAGNYEEGTTSECTAFYNWPLTPSTLVLSIGGIALMAKFLQNVLRAPKTESVATETEELHTVETQE